MGGTACGYPTRTETAKGAPTVDSPDRPSENPADDPTSATRKQLEELVDDMEERIADERDRQGVAGSSSEREQTEPIDTGDEAPD